MISRILIPTDGSAQSAKAIRYGVALAKAQGASVVGLFAAPPPTPVVYAQFMPIDLTSPEEHAKLIRKSAAKYLGVIETAAKKADVAHECVCVTDDFPADAILRVAREKKIDLIVMASHGRRGIAGVLLGSETQKVLTHANIPVLVYR